MISHPFLSVAPAGAKLEDHFKVGDWVRTRILRIEEDEKKVGLSMRGVTQPSAEEIAELQAREGKGEEEGQGSKQEGSEDEAEGDEE